MTCAGSLLSFQYINDMDFCTRSKNWKFANDAEVYNVLNTEQDSVSLIKLINSCSLKEIYVNLG